MKSKYSLLLIALLWCVPIFAQVSVTPNCDLGKCQLLDKNGHPLAGGKVFSYDSGTTTARNTYKDSIGISQNTDPVILDAGGYASIWLANQAYKFCVYNSANVLQYPCTDGVTGYLGILNFANTWTFPQTFSGAITDTLTDNQIILGAPGVQTTLDFPPPAVPITLHFPNTGDTMVGRNTTDTLTNKTITAPTVTGGTFSAPALTVLKNLVPVTVTGAGSSLVYTIPIAAGVMGPNNNLRVTLVIRSNNSGGSPFITIAYGGSTISTTTVNAANTNQDDLYTVVVGGNTGFVTNAQTWDTLAGWYGVAQSVGGGNRTSTAVDSTLSQSLTVTYHGNAGPDSITFYRVLVEIL